MKIVYITGCLGFMGSHMTRKALKKGWAVYGVDKMTYAANSKHLREFEKYSNVTLKTWIEFMIAIM